jgi:hypothetical protein
MREDGISYLILISFPPENFQFNTAQNVTFGGVRASSSATRLTATATRTRPGSTSATRQPKSSGQPQTRTRHNRGHLNPRSIPFATEPTSVNVVEAMEMEEISEENENQIDIVEEQQAVVESADEANQEESMEQQLTVNAVEHQQAVVESALVANQDESMEQPAVAGLDQQPTVDTVEHQQAVIESAFEANQEESMERQPTVDAVEHQQTASESAVDANQDESMEQPAADLDQQQTVYVIDSATASVCETEQQLHVYNAISEISEPAEGAHLPEPAPSTSGGNTTPVNRNLAVDVGYFKTPITATPMSRVKGSLTFRSTFCHLIFITLIIYFTFLVTH